MHLPKDGILRIIQDLVAEELNHSRGQPAAPFVTDTWGAETPLTSTEVGADSLDLTTLATAVNELFQLHEVGTEDFLLRYPLLGEWANLVQEALQEGTSGLTFRTSGSTGSPKRVAHTWTGIEQELAALTPLFPGVKRVLALVPSHHIFGFLYTVALPARWGVPVVSGRQAWEAAQHELAPGDLIVTFPARWRYLLSSRGEFPAGVMGVSSTAPLPGEVHEGLKQRGLEQLVEVYGATETGGVGVRLNPGAPFRLLPHWQRDPAMGEGVQRLDADGQWQAPTALMDRPQWTDGERFFPQGREDGAVQVGGINVHPEWVAETLRTHPWVQECAVRLMRPEEGNRLKAFVVLTEDAPSEAEAHDDLDGWMAGQFTAPQRPRALTFGPRLPRSAMGKAADW